VRQGVAGATLEHYRYAGGRVELVEATSKPQNLKQNAAIA
jgi:hypothetical protein